MCGIPFLHKHRVQGGGQRQKYCSYKCRALAWVRGNPEKRKAIISKYERVPENKEKKRLRMRRDVLRKHGWTIADFERQLKRQNFSCAGCLTPLNDVTARVDHCHTSNKIRGLLCNNCNLALGGVRDNPATLRRLMAYLERDVSRTLVYLIGALKNDRVPEVGGILRAQGFDVMDEWFTPGRHADTNWQKYERQRGRSYAEALKGRAATNIFLFDRAYLDLSDVAILIMPAGKSAMLELGYAKGRGKRTIIYLDGQEPERYDIMPKFADKVVLTEEGLLLALHDWFGEQFENHPQS